jgi:glycosyltransferase involved in cell wall biosynthesis
MSTIVCHDAETAQRVGARPLRVMFVQTSMPVGGAETLTVELVRRLNRERFSPELCCLKQPGPLGEMLADEVPVHHGLLSGKYDLSVWPRLVRLFRRRQIKAVVTMGAGDKMFWGRLAAKRAGVPVIVSALHSTGWPDSIGRLNRLLTPITDAFVAVAPSHGRFLIEREHLPAEKVVVVPNGVDTERFRPRYDTAAIRRGLGIEPSTPVVAILAALRPEKNHELFLEAASRVARRMPAARFLVIGDGPRRAALEQLAAELGIESRVLFLGSRRDVPRLLAAADVLALTSHNEANPLSILEAMSVGRPVVATNVGSVGDVVRDGRTGYLIRPGDADALAVRLVQLLDEPLLSVMMGRAARELVLSRWSVEAMVAGYEELISSLYERRTGTWIAPQVEPSLVCSQLLGS